jgi:hypothetical protein
MALPIRRTPIAIGVLTIVALSGGAAYAVTTTAQSSALRSPVAASVTDFTSHPAATVYLEADLNGKNEQTKAPQTPMGDPRGSAMEILRIRGNQVAFEISWQNLAAPTTDKVHAGAAGTAGASVIPMLTQPMSDTLTAVAGTVTVNDRTMLNRLVGKPSQFYANFGDARYPNGAVRGQFRTIGPVDFERILHVGPFAALGGGDQEVFAGGSANARTTAFLGLGTSSINYAVSWTGVNSPTAFTVNKGAVGANGALAATLFVAPRGLAPSITAVAGTAMNVPASTIAAVKASPAMFHSSLTTAGFPGGAARGQLFLTAPTTPTTIPTMPTQPTTTMPAPTTMPTQPTTMPTQPTMPTMPTGTAPAPPHW